MREGSSHPRPQPLPPPSVSQPVINNVYMGPPMCQPLLRVLGFWGVPQSFNFGVGNERPYLTYNVCNIRSVLGAMQKHKVE